MEPCCFQGIKNIPPYLYKYVSAKRALEIMLTQKIYFAHRKEFNDPRDGAFNDPRDGALHGEDEIREAVLNLKDTSEGYQDKLDDTNLGFFSMSEYYDSYPMWAHYADQHRGCCLTFNCLGLKSDYKWEDYFPFVFVERMGYPNKDEELPGVDTAQKTIPHHKDSIYMNKQAEWRYEQEWRAIMYNGAYAPFGEVLFDSKYPFFQKMKGKGLYTLKEKFLDGITLGRNMEEATKEAVKVAATKFGVTIINLGARN